MANAQEIAACFGAGVFLHLFVFRKGEWDDYSFTVLKVTAIIQLLLTLFAHQVYDQSATATSSSSSAAAAAPSLWDAFQHATLWTTSALAGLYTSLLAYRASPFHRLAPFPGPFSARLSTFHMTWQSVRRGQLYQDVRALHARYGDYVRVGPSEISLADPAAFSAVHAATSQCERGPWYDILNPTVSLQMVRDRKEHARRRKAWDRGFGAKALRDYEARVARYTDQLLGYIGSQVAKKEGDGDSGSGSGSGSGKVNASKWFNYYSFDIMGDLAFGKTFNMMRDGVDHYFFKTTHANMVLIGIFSRMVWLFPIFKATVGRWEYSKFQRFVRGLVQRRIENEPHVPDVFHWILSDFNENPKPTWQEKENLVGDASLIVVAGSDTTAATLTCMFFHFATHPHVYKALQKEVDALYANAGDNVNDNVDDNGQHEEIDAGALGKLPYLQACIDESLRLFPPVPSGLQRQTPPQGLSIGDVWIPGNTIVMTPTYTLNRDPRTFPRGDEFIPERWTSQPELVKDATPNAPFSVGRFSCVGKHLGLMEVRRVTALIARKYDVALAPGQTKEAFVSGLRDNFTLATPDLQLTFSRR